MASYSGYLMTGVPVNSDVDKIDIYSGDYASATFGLIESIDYDYPTRSTEYEIDEDLWYKIAFREDATGWESPPSDAIDGAQILKATPTFELTSTTDGVPFATAADVYARSHMSTDDAAETDVDYSLSIARAYIDLRLSNVNVDRYRDFSTPVAGRKFNAQMKLIKNAEINYALSLVYKNLADDKIMDNVTSSGIVSTSVSVGQTSIGGLESGGTIETATYFDALSARYSAQAIEVMNLILPNYIPLRYGENGTGYDDGFREFVSRSNGAVSFNFADGLVLDRMGL